MPSWSWTSFIPTWWTCLSVGINRLDLSPRPLTFVPLCWLFNAFPALLPFKSSSVVRSHHHKPLVSTFPFFKSSPVSFTNIYWTHAVHQALVPDIGDTELKRQSRAFQEHVSQLRSPMELLMLGAHIQKPFFKRPEVLRMMVVRWVTKNIIPRNVLYVLSSKGWEGWHTVVSLSDLPLPTV